MRVQRCEGSRERTVLISMITDTSVLSRITSKWDRELFGSPWSNLIATWCVDYYRQYKEAPRQVIQRVYASWVESHNEPETAKLVDRFLSSLSEEYENGEGLNSDLVMDMAHKHFRRVRLSKVVEQIQGDLDMNQDEEAEHRIEKYSRIEMGLGARISLVNDPDQVASAFMSDDEEPPLVSYPGDLGFFFRDILSRDGFVAFQGKGKSAKSFWLHDLAYRAVCQRRRVAIFEVGDMSELQVKHRFYTRVAKHPYRSPTGRWPCKIRVPVTLAPPEDGNVFPARVAFKERLFTKRLDRSRAGRACEDLMTFQVRSNKSYCYLSVHPNSTMSVAGIRSTLQAWALEDGWIPDIIVIDYADILAPPVGVRETRDQINTNWKQLRALSQELHCLVVTATQADSASYSKITMDMSNFSEDHRKNTHCTGLVAINCTPVEKELGLCRLNWIVARDMEYSIKRCVHVAGCLALASPAMKSTF